MFNSRVDSEMGGIGLESGLLSLILTALSRLSAKSVCAGMRTASLITSVTLVLSALLNSLTGNDTDQWVPDFVAATPLMVKSDNFIAGVLISSVSIVAQPFFTVTVAVGL